MHVGAWTSAVAYLPEDSPLPIETRTLIASKAWRCLNTIESSTSDEEEDDEEERDLWEERYYGGRERMGNNLPSSSLLPDPSLLQPGALDSDSLPIPFFFAVEVGELPRGGAIEWHAHQGVVNGPVKVSSNGNVLHAFFSRSQAVVIKR